MYNNSGENGEVFDCSPHGSPLCSPKGHSREAGKQSHSRPTRKSGIGTDSRAVPSGKVYRQLFDAQVQLSRSLLATWKDQSVQSNTQCSTASSEKELIDTDDTEDVSGLPDTLVTSGSSSDVIERMSKKKVAKHQETLLQLDTELTAISKISESHVRANSEKLLTSLQEVNLRLDELSHRMERTEELTSHSLQDVCSLWEEVEEKVKLKKSRIMEFFCNLCQTETQRTIQIQAVLKNHGGLLEKICFLPLSDIQRLLHSKATMLNQSLLANRRSLSQLRLHLLVENLQGASVLHQRWEDCMEQWRNSRIQQIVQNFSELCSKDMDEELFSEQPEIVKTHQSLRELSVRRRETVSSLSSLVPPTCTSVLVSDWFDQLKSFNHQIDGLHADLVRCIRNCYDQIWQERLEEVHRCENTLRDLRLSEAQVTNIVQSSFLPLIGQSQTEADEQLATFDISCDSVSSHSLSLSSSVFGIMHQASFLWEEHCSNLKNIETKVQQDVKELRHLQKEQLKQQTVHLDEQLSILRQESNEKTLNISHDKALLELQKLHDSCRQHLLDQNTVLDKLPALYLLELQNYSSRLSAFFHLSSIYTPSLDEFGSAFSDLDSSLKATLTLDKENKQKNTDAAEYQDDGGLLDLCNMNSSEAFRSSRGLTYKGPCFTCQSPELKEPQGNKWQEVFPVMLLSQTLSRVRSMYVEHMEQHFHDSVFSASSLHSHLRQEALIEQDVKLQQLSAQNVKQRIFQPRLAELRLHIKQVDIHCETVSHTLSSLDTDLKELLDSVGKKNQTFSTTVSSLESDLRSVDSLQRLETLSSILKDYLENHMADTRISQTNFRKNVQVQLEQLKQATTQLLSSFRLFSEGGNFTPYEIKMFQKRLKKEMKKINVEEESIHGQLEACHSSSLQQVREVYSLQEKMTSLKSEFLFVEKTQKILRSTQVKIKAVAATCNQQQSGISSKIHELQILLEVREAQVCQAQVFSTLSVLSQTLQQQAQCLHDTLVSQQHHLQEDTLPSEPLSSPSSALQPYGSGGALHDDPLLRVIKSLNRISAFPETERRGGEGPSSGPIQRSEQSPAIRRGGRALRVDWRMQMFGPRPEHGQDTLSFSSKVNALLWETSDVLMLTAEDFYRSSHGINQFLLVPDNLDQWVDKMQQRLLGYLEQARSFLKSSKKEFVMQLSTLEQVCQKLPELLLRLHEHQHQEKLLAEMDRIRQKLDQIMAESETEKNDTVSQLRLCISGEALQTLVLREQHRQQALSSAINSSAGAQKECLQMAGEDFVTSLASLTEQLLSLLDVLMTEDEVKAIIHHSENTAFRPHTGKRTWQGIPYLPFSVGTKATASISTNKCTRGHEVVIQERDATVKRFGEMYRRELLRLDSDKHKKLLEVEKWSVHWSQQLHTLTHILS